MAAETKRLYRSRTQRVIGGVCGGLGEYLSLDPLLVRLIFVVLVLFGGPVGLIAYLLFLIFVPLEPEATQLDTTDSM